MAERNYLPEFMDRGRSYMVRKPPGGDTNDIFDLERRQRQMKISLYKDLENENATASGMQNQKKYHETDDILDPRNDTRRIIRRSLSDCSIDRKEQRVKTPPIAPGKENIDAHFKKQLSPRLIVNSDKERIDDSEDEDEDESDSSKKQVNLNPITGERLGRDASYRNKLEDATNIVNAKNKEVKGATTPVRPCIRVRQPPGGKSSIVF